MPFDHFSDPSKLRFQLSTALARAVESANPSLPLRFNTTDPARLSTQNTATNLISKPPPPSLLACEHGNRVSPRGVVIQRGAEQTRFRARFRYHTEPAGCDVR